MDILKEKQYFAKLVLLQIIIMFIVLFTRISLYSLCFFCFYRQITWNKSHWAEIVQHADFQSVNGFIRSTFVYYDPERWPTMTVTVAKCSPPFLFLTYEVLASVQWFFIQCSWIVWGLSGVWNIPVSIQRLKTNLILLHSWGFVTFVSGLDNPL